MGRGFTLVEVLVVVLVIAVLATVGAAGWANARDRADTQACAENRWQIDRAKQVWAIENGRDPDDAPEMADLHPHHLKSLPVCPRAGDYRLGAINEPCSCSHHSP